MNEERKKSGYYAALKKWRGDKEAVHVGGGAIDTLRGAAADLGLYVSRGAGAGKLGNAAALMELVAAALERDRGGVLETLREWQAASADNDAAPGA